MGKIAIVRIRGRMGIKKSIKDTLNMLRLYNKHHCIVIEGKPSYVGMLKQVKDYVTWGEIDEKTFHMLLKERGRIVGNKKLTEAYFKEKVNLTFNEFTKEFFSSKKTLKDVPGLKPFFKLKPPLRGFERGGIKKPFSLGGVLGYRKEKINDLVQRML